MKLTRRHVVAAVAAIPAAGALCGGGLYARWWDRPPGAGRLRMSEDEYDFVQAIAEAWLPPGGTPALSGREADLGGFLDGVLAGMTDAAGNELRVLLQALDDLTWPTHGAAYRSLPLAERTLVLKGWLHSDLWLLRNATQAVLVLMGTGYSTHPEVAAVLRPMFPCGLSR